MHDNQGKVVHCLGAADICCVSLVSNYLEEIPRKNYNYIFVFIKVIPETLPGPFFGHGVVAYSCAKAVPMCFSELLQQDHI